MPTTSKVKLTWTHNDATPDVGVEVRKSRRALYFDTSREADKFASQWLQGRTNFKFAHLDMEPQQDAVCERCRKSQAPNYEGTDNCICETSWQ